MGNLANYPVYKLSIYELLTELNLEQLDELVELVEEEKGRRLEIAAEEE